MPTTSDPHRASIPRNSILFGFGPMVPFAAAAIGAFVLPPPWPTIATRLAILWGGLILAFVAGVRRGYGFGNPHASTPHAIGAMLLYFVPAGLALVSASLDLPTAALGLLMLGFALVIVFDRRAALAGDAPDYFARLRGPQMAIALVSLAILLLRAWR